MSRIFNKPHPFPEWQKKIFKFTLSSPRKATVQLINTFVPYIFLWALMVLLFKSGTPFWVTLGVAALAALFLVRIFIFFHDCCHGSFLPSKRANRIIGYITGTLTFTPFVSWKCSHIKHHTTASDLDRRGTGDVWTLTREEYLSKSRTKRLVYRIYRNPFFMLVFGPAFVFLIKNRFLSDTSKNQITSVLLTNVFIAGIVVLASMTMGLRTYMLIQLPVILMAGSIGIWLFYVQHQFNGVYWARHESWDPMKAAMKGASYYKLPKILQWFSGNIGFHFIHHLRPTIPNYHLQLCYNEIPELQKVKPLTIRQSLGSLALNLWDEQQEKMINFRALKKKDK